MTPKRQVRKGIREKATAASVPHRRQGIDAMAELRKRAEKFLTETGGTSDSRFVGEDLPRLLHELQVYQAELEIQNTELREAQDALEVSRNHYFHLFEDAPVAYFLLDQRGMIQKTNRAGGLLLGIDAEKAVDRPFPFFLAPQERVPFSTLHLANHDTNGGTRNSEVEMAIPFRPGCFTRLESRPWLGGRDQPNILLAASDITEQRRSSRALQESESRFRLLFENSRDALIITSDQDKITQVNRATERLFGRGFKELFDRRLGDLLTPPPPPLETASEEGRETAISIPKGETRYVEYVGSRFAPGLQLWILRDITRRREEQEALRSAKEAVEISDRVKTEFLNNISHELRTPMNAIMGMTELLRLTRVNEEQRQFLDHAYSAGEHLLTLINDIIDLSRLEADENGVEPFDFWFSDLIDQLKKTLMTGWQEGPVTFSCHIDPNLPKKVRGDLVRLRQAIGHLLVNSRKFTEKGTIALRVSLLDQRGDLATVRFEIKDTGIGMSKGMLDQLFKPFTTADGSSTRKHGGLGVGLAICRKHVDRMKGRIEIESEPGQGSVFRIDIPLKVSRG